MLSASALTGNLKIISNKLLQGSYLSINILSFHGLCQSVETCAQHLPFYSNRTQRLGWLSCGILCSNPTAKLGAPSQGGAHSRWSLSCPGHQLFRRSPHEIPLPGGGDIQPQSRTMEESQRLRSVHSWRGRLPLTKGENRKL